MEIKTKKRPFDTFEDKSLYYRPWSRKIDQLGSTTARQLQNKIFYNKIFNYLALISQKISSFYNLHEGKQIEVELSCYVVIQKFHRGKNMKNIVP